LGRFVLRNISSFGAQKKGVEVAFDAPSGIFLSVWFKPLLLLVFRFGMSHSKQLRRK